MSGLSIQLPEEENIVLSAPVVRRLIAADNGDAVLLYLALLQCRDDPEGQKLRALLPWPAGRLEQAEAARRARESVRRAQTALEAGVTPDALLTDVEEALEALGELTGQSVREDIVDRIFQRFCVGK